MSTSTKQHYVPKLYLKGFCSDNKQMMTWVCYKKFLDNRKFWHEKSIRSICKEEGLYNQDKSEEFDKSIQKLETSISKILSNLNTFKEEISLDPKDLGSLAFWIGLQLHRVPDFINYYTSSYKEAFENILFNSASCKLATEIAEKGLDAKEIEVTVDKAISFKAIVEQARNFGEEILEKCWQFYKVPYPLNQTQFFITSDNPVISILSPAPVTSNNSIIIYPINKHLALICVNCDVNHMKICDANENVIKIINKFIVSSSSEYIISPKQSDEIKKLIYDVLLPRTET